MELLFAQAEASKHGTAICDAEDLAASAGQCRVGLTWKRRPALRARLVAEWRETNRREMST